MPAPAPPRRALCAAHLALALLVAGALLALTGCPKPRGWLPGHTNWDVSEVRYEGATLGLGKLPEKLGLRAQSVIVPGQPYNPYRAAEDAKRIAAFWQQHGYLDVVVHGPELEREVATRTMVVTWRLEEGRRYTVGSVAVEGTPPLDGATQDVVEGMVPFAAGDGLDFEAYRWVRWAMSDRLRRMGWHHAEVYSRAWVRRDQGLVHWRYLVDTGPRTVVGSVHVHGNVKIPAEAVLDRLALEPGDPFDLDDRDKAEQDLLDLGTFHVVRVETNADNEFLIGALPPDTGGRMKAGSVDADGRYVARELDPALRIDVHVVESPAVAGRVSVGAAVDASRVDGFVGGELAFRNALGPLHHLTLRGRVGYGHQFASGTDDPLGLWGEVEGRWDAPGLLGALGDLSVIGHFEQRLMPGFFTRRVTGALQLATHPVKDLHLQLDLPFVWEVAGGYLDPLEVDEAVRKDAALTAGDGDDPLMGLLPRLSLIWDTRDTKIEAKKGWLLGAHLSGMPGGPLGTHQFLTLTGEGRGFVPIDGALSVALRARGTWVLFAGDNGVPAGERLYGGGGFGMRGAAFQRLTSFVDACDVDGCRSVAAGARSLVEAQAEIRWLPYREQVGAVGWVDAGAAGPGADPFADGVTVAVGAGLRVRTWHFPIGIDLGVRLTDTAGTPWYELFVVYARVGEAF